RVLPGQTDQPADLGRVTRHVDALHEQAAVIRSNEGCDRAHERGLARAVRAEQRDDAPGFGDQIEAVERGDLAVVLREAVGFDKRNAHNYSVSGASRWNERHRSRPSSSPDSMSLTKRFTYSSSVSASACMYSSSSM